MPVTHMQLEADKRELQDVLWDIGSSLEQRGYANMTNGKDIGILLDQAEHAAKERDDLYGYVAGLLGLLQLVCGRDDMPAEIADVLRTNHRAVDAAEYLAQIAPHADTE